jgi:4-hydroxybenzoate polyprenyltransferase
MLVVNPTVSSAPPELLEKRIPGRAFTASGLITCMRPIQWVKNGFVLTPLMFAAKMDQPALVLREVLAFIAFCLIASGVYLCNDALDWKADLLHPEKRRRPVPSGRLSAKLAAACGVILLLAGLAVGLELTRLTEELLCIYAVINILYSLWLKNAVILDMMCIAGGFVLRVLAGAAAIQVEASHWLLMCTFLLALFLAIAKRREEVVTLAADRGKHRRVLDNYTLPWLDQASTITASATIVAYALYTVAPETLARFHTDGLIYTLPFVIYGILRYLHLIGSSSTTGNPTAALLKDRPLMVCIAGWAVACGVVIYR